MPLSTNVSCRISLATAPAFLHTSLDLIVAGSVPPNPAELLESQTTPETLRDLKERYDLVVLDTAPTGVVADAFPLVSQVDGVVIVARIGQATRDEAETLRSRLDAPLLGIVSNGLEVRHRGKYGYYGSEEAPQGWRGRLEQELRGMSSAILATEGRSLAAPD